MHIDDFNLCKTHYSVVYDHNFSQFIKQVLPLKNQFEYQHKMHNFFSCTQKRNSGGLRRIFYAIAIESERRCMMKVTFQSCKIVSNPILNVIKSQKLRSVMDERAQFYAFNFLPA